MTFAAIGGFVHNHMHTRYESISLEMMNMCISSQQENLCLLLRVVLMAISHRSTTGTNETCLGTPRINLDFLTQTPMRNMRNHPSDVKQPDNKSNLR